MEKTSLEGNRGDEPLRRGLDDTGDLNDRWRQIDKDTF